MLSVDFLPLPVDTYTLTATIYKVPHVTLGFTHMNSHNSCIPSSYVGRLTNSQGPKASEGPC